ncbi:MAG: DUF6057 family protein, partial [Bacteroidia bacterium]|nr:DUF6057 family protein [Bacteroidia bacterium]
YDYLIAYLILKNDLGKLAQILQGDTNILPQAVQEALVFHWMMHNKTFEGIPWKIDQQVVMGAIDFMRQLNSGGNMRSMNARFGKTYWYYNTFASQLIQ